MYLHFSWGCARRFAGTGYLITSHGSRVPTIDAPNESISYFFFFFFIISFLFLKFTSSNYSENNCPTTMHSFHSRPSSEFSGLFDIRFRLEIKWCLCQRVSFGEWVIFFLLQFKRARACNRSGKKGSLRQKRGDSEGAFTIDKRAKVEQSRASSMAITDNESGQTL